MPQLFTTLAPHALHLFGLIFLHFFVVIVFIFVLFALVLGEFASGHVLTSLSAAPPHLTSILRCSMRPATPIKVLFFMEFLAAILAALDAVVEFALPGLELDDSLFHFITLVQEGFHLFFEFVFFLD